MDRIVPVKMRRGKRNKFEELEQAAFFQWRDFNLHRYPGIDLMFSSANGAYLQGGKDQRARQWAKLKKLGAKKGVHDVFLPKAIGNYIGLWLEFKAPKPHKSNISPEQKDWAVSMKKNGYMVRFVYGCDEAIAAVEAYYNAPGML